MKFLSGNSGGKHFQVNNFSLCSQCLCAGLSRPAVRLPLLFDEVMTAFFIDGKFKAEK